MNIEENTYFRIFEFNTPERVYLGMIDRDRIYLYKHTWACAWAYDWYCNWYWDFGHVGNSHLYFDIESLITDEAEVEINKIFSETKLSQNNWCVIRALFIQAYALQRAAEICRYVGHNATYPVKDDELIARLNADLERIIDKVWEYINNIEGIG